MTERILEISQEGLRLSLERGFLIVSREQEEIGKIPLDDLLGVIINSHQSLLSKNILVELARRNVAVVFCDSFHRPAGVLWPAESHHRQSFRMKSQMESTLPLAKRLWKQIVQSKIQNQSQILKLMGKPFEPVAYFIDQVKVGDTENMEAQAAMRYWPLLLGADFKRGDVSQIKNAMLNYGYAVLRAAVARFVMGAGLHPALGLHHCNPTDTMTLVDDLMEPFRPLVDWVVVQVDTQDLTELDKETKARLVSVLEMEVKTRKEETVVTRLIERAAISLGQVYEARVEELDLPSFEILKEGGESESE